MNNLPDTACKQERFEQGFGTLLRWQCQSPGAPVGQSSNFFPGILLTICFRLTENELKKKILQVKMEMLHTISVGFGSVFLSAHQAQMDFFRDTYKNPR